MPRVSLNRDVLSLAVERLERLYVDGHRVVVAFSGGKDSTVCVELAIMAARNTGRLPVEVVVQDEEVSYPGTYDFIERTANRSEVSMNWLVMRQPMLNIFNRAEPYFWVMDPLLKPEQWMRLPPPYAQFTEDKAIELMVNPIRFPVASAPTVDGKLQILAKRQKWDFEDTTQKLVTVVGLRVAESWKRLMGLHASGGYMTGSNDLGVFMTRPVYDWKDPDVWKFINETKCDYNTAYDTLYKMGVPGRRLRIGPPTMTAAGIEALQYAARAWPSWFDRVCQRVPGIRTAVQFGRRAVQANRRLGESWEDCFKRECLGPDVPQWIRDRAQTVMERRLSNHASHSASPFPETSPCMVCGAVLRCWHELTDVMWNGDPYCLKTQSFLTMVEPDYFRPGAGTWAGNFANLVGHHVKVIF